MPLGCFKKSTNTYLVELAGKHQQTAMLEYLLDSFKDDDALVTLSSFQKHFVIVTK